MIKYECPKLKTISTVELECCCGVLVGAGR